ncbi:hypothetical protein L211DRAFT_580297 [Terfezia boudieri ATCC MYA-4762]|uniref:Uncharacterized protein n=1 Tax=Terfezia boudieri ATCC MYA-4762 TaxID=1051890 RepID=A0A3N4LAN0_9PEZI|nr:hypothetical protein L211DRAFT_580297 [Terfezia boudieri ATCC MYA-4762]
MTPEKGKRKDNPGKMDRVNPPLKTRIPVTDHPEPQYGKALPLQPPPPQVNPVTDAALLFAREICIHSRINCVPGGLIKATWCLRELLTFVRGDVERIFGDEVFAECAKNFTDLLDYGGAAWVYSTSPLPPTTTESSTQTTPPPQTQVTQTTGTQTTPSITPTSNSISTNTDPPKSPPRNTYKLPDHTSDPETEADHQQRLHQHGPASNVCGGHLTLRNNVHHEPHNQRAKAKQYQHQHRTLRITHHHRKGWNWSTLTVQHR